MIFQNARNQINRFLTHYLDTTQDREDPQTTVQTIRDGIEFKGANILILIFAVFIASLGLNTNSAAVIIGAMLISPLVGPIMGIGLGVGIYDFDLIKRSFRNLAVATLFSVLTSTIYFLISPLNDARSELLARTSPTIYDVLIAFFGGMAGIVAASTKLRNGTVIPGVAIATALMPPLCTAGFGLAIGNLYYFFGALYLFFINSVFIAFATTLGTKIMKFAPKEFLDENRKKRVKQIVYVIIVVTMAPSIYLTYNMIRQNFFETAANTFIAKELNYPNTQIIDKSVSMVDGKRVIRVSMIGKEVPKDSLLVAETLLKKYGLQGTVLEVKQGYGQNDIDISTLNSMMFKDIYQDSQIKIAQLDSKVDSLRNVITNYKQFDSIAAKIAPEIRVLFPMVNDIAISKAVFSRVDSIRLDTTMVAVVKYAHPLSSEQYKRFTEWLEARLDVKSIQVITENRR